MSIMTIDMLDQRDLRYSIVRTLAPLMYSQTRLRRLARMLVRKFEPDPFVSGTIRLILRKYHSVSVGAYSYGACLQPGNFPANVTVGRYVSVARDVSVFRRNHPMDRLSLHPYFYNASLGTVEQDNMEHAPLSIGHDAWIGDGVKITPSCKSIGIGAVVGTGSVVTKDVPDFAVVVGVPARVIKFRFDDDFQQSILASRWWERSKSECLQEMEWMVRPLDSSFSHPLLR